MRWVLLVLFPCFLFGEQPPHDGVRLLWDTTFLSRRPAAGPAAAPYAAVAGLSTESFVGVTVWRLRPSTSADNPGVRLLAHTEPGSRQWTPVRVGADSPLAEGDRVRISIETARPGYLYVIDREQYAGRVLGDPVLIFPTSRLRGGNNRVRPGALVELPGWDDHPPYWRLRRARPDHVGEMLTILVTPRPIPGLITGDEAIRLDPQRVAAWEKRWDATVERLEAPHQAGRPYSAAEKQAARNAAQLLTPDDPAPQTLFRVEARPDQPLLVNLPLRIRN